MNIRTRNSRRSFLLAGLAGLAGTAAAQCRRTPTDALGPYYIPGQPAQTDLCQRDASPGMVVTGRVLGFPECRPVAGALVEVWHANARGIYSRIDKMAFDDLACLMRGAVRSGEDGRYSFRTLAPGAYLGRPRHIHFRVSAPGYRTLVTQMYFPPQEGTDPRLLAKPAPEKPGAAPMVEFDLNVAPV